jgi:hypothetical protein
MPKIFHFFAHCISYEHRQHHPDQEFEDRIKYYKPKKYA